jgi:hypothetical protein
VYAAPRGDSAFGRRAAAWLGRHIDPLPAPGDDERPVLQGFDLDELTAEARLYGFHATLKPPFRLADGGTIDEVEVRVADLAAGRAPVVVPALGAELLSGFAAFRPADPSAEVDDLAAACVTELDEFRRPVEELELARRRRGGLSSRQDALLTEFGYPYVLDQFRYHMTLTRRLREAEVEPVLDAARTWFDADDGVDFTIDELCVVTQTAPGEPFVVRSRHPMGVAGSAQPPEH